MKDKIDEFMEKRGYDKMQLVKKEEAKGQTVYMYYVPELKTGYDHIVLVDDGENLHGGGRTRSRDDIEANFQNALKDIRTDWLNEAKEYFRGKDGFKVVEETETNTGQPAIKVFSGGYRLTLGKGDIKNEHHKYVTRHWDKIKQVTEDVVRGHQRDERVFYSEIQNRLENKVPHANSASSSAMFHTAVELIENEGIEVHS